jgi:Leucine-rich repeat (LRR) protein
MRIAIVFISLLMSAENFSAQEQVSLGLCDTLPKGFYNKDIDTLIIQNGMGYCESPFKTLDKRIQNFKNLTFLEFYSDYTPEENHNATLPSEITQLSKLNAVSTNVPNAALLQMTGLKSLTLHSLGNLLLLADVGFAELTSLEELSLSFSALKKDYQTRGIAQLKNLKRVTLSNPNQAIVDEVLSNPNIESLSILYTNENIVMDFRYATLLKSITLQNNQLKEIPTSIFNLKNLEKLHISYNEISKISEEIVAVTALKELVFVNNKLVNVGGFISELSNLEKLDISGNKELTSIPAEIGTLSNLKILAASNCNLGDVPKEISNCSVLEELYIDNNVLTLVNIDFSNLKKLTTLTLHKNKITRIEQSMFELPLLAKMDLSDNSIKELPRSIKEMKNLIFFSAVNNQIERLPEDFGECSLLETISVYNNKIVNLPSSIFQLTELRTLYCGNNEITLFATGFSSLKKLQALEIQNNPLKSFPAEIYNLPSLDKVWVSKSYNNLNGFRESAKNPMTIFIR